MNRTASRAVAAAACFTVTSAGAADRAVIDTDQKAAAATLAAHFFLLDSGQELTLSRQLIQVTYPPLDLATNALKSLAAATTPAALMGMRNGLTLACEFGGTFNARMTRNQPGVLKLQWTDCVARQFESDPTFQHKLNGPATLELQGNSFSTKTLTLLRIGDATTDVTADSEQHEEDFDAYDTRSFNLRLAGTVPIGKNSAGWYVGDFEYHANGFWKDSGRTEFHSIQGEPPSVVSGEQRLVIDQAALSGTLVFEAPYAYREDDLFIERGTFRVESPDNSPPRSGTFSVSANNLHIHSVSDRNTLIRGSTLDGRADISWPAAAGAGCLSGGYVFRTDKLLENWLANGEIYKAGTLNINNVLTTRYSSPDTQPPVVYPPAPRGSVQLDIKRIGSFSHDFEWRIPYLLGFTNVAKCMAWPTP
jgi:hypothetical protein